MSMGYDANFAEVIEEENLAKIINDSALLTTFIEEYNRIIMDEDTEYGPEELAALLNDTDDKDFLETEISKRWREISNKFYAATGIHLYVEYHDTDDGSCYDEVEGLYFHVSSAEIYEPTQAYKALKEKFGDDIVNRSYYTYYC